MEHLQVTASETSETRLAIRVFLVLHFYILGESSSKSYATPKADPEIWALYFFTLFGNIRIISNNSQLLMKCVLQFSMKSFFTFAFVTRFT